MPRYVILINWTDQGIRNARDTVERVEQARSAVARLGGQLVDVYWTQGAFDMVAVAEFPDDEAVTAFLLGLGGAGNVRTQTLRAFGAEEMRRILQKLPSP